MVKEKFKRRIDRRNELNRKSEPNGLAWKVRDKKDGKKQ